VTINGNGTVSLSGEYDSLQQKYSKIDISLIESASPQATGLTPPKCSKDLISDSGFSKDFSIPKLPPGGQDLIDNGVGKDYVRGKLVDVKDTKSPMAAYGANGGQIENLAIRKLANDDSNTPGGENSPSPTQGEAAAATSKKGSASTLSVHAGCGVLLSAALLVLTLL
jgi:hypothetical protein